MPSRRSFLRTGIVAGGALLTGLAPTVASALAGVASARREQRILVLGGTGFIGPHLVRLLVSRGHTVTIFTRGRRQASLPSSVERLVGDRAITAERPNGDLTALADREWDIVLDDNATDPRWVRASTAMLRDSGRYLYVSSTGVYHPYNTPRNDESAFVQHDPPDGGTPQFGHNKARSERIAQEMFGRSTIIVRPGYIVGPGDRTDRFSYWPQRFAQGGEILVPGRQQDPTQFVDVRDLAAFMVRLVEDDRSGIYNVTGPAEPLHWGGFISETRAAIRPDAEPVWIDDPEFLRQHGLVYTVPWILPEGDNAYHTRIDNRKAVAAGLTFRPIAETVRATLQDWPARLAELPAGAEPNFRWMNPERERELIATWRAR